MVENEKELHGKIDAFKLLQTLGIKPLDFIEQLVSDPTADIGINQIITLFDADEIALEIKENDLLKPAIKEQIVEEYQQRQKPDDLANVFMDYDTDDQQAFFKEIAGGVSFNDVAINWPADEVLETSMITVVNTLKQQNKYGTLNALQALKEQHADELETNK